MWAISFTMEFPDKCLEIGAYLVDVILIRSELYITPVLKRRRTGFQQNCWGVDVDLPNGSFVLDSEPVLGTEVPVRGFAPRLGN